MDYEPEYSVPDDVDGDPVEPSEAPVAGETSEEINDSSDSGFSYDFSRIESSVHVLDHDFLSTAFEEYTVTEGLLLLIFLALLVGFVLKIVKGAFSWLR